MPRKRASLAEMKPPRVVGAEKTLYVDAPQVKERGVPTTFHIPESVHRRLKSRASAKSASMVDIVVDGIGLALESEKYRLTEEERRRLLGE